MFEELKRRLWWMENLI